jgi:hypothetical protein
MVQLVCFGPYFLQGSQLFLAMPPQQSKISGKHVFLYLPSLKEHIPVFIIFFRPKLQELRGVEVAPPLSAGAKTYQLYHRKLAYCGSGFGYIWPYLFQRTWAIHWLATPQSQPGGRTGGRAAFHGLR